MAGGQAALTAMGTTLSVGMTMLLPPPLPMPMPMPISMLRRMMMPVAMLALLPIWALSVAVPRPTPVPVLMLMAASHCGWCAGRWPGALLQRLLRAAHAAARGAGALHPAVRGGAAHQRGRHRHSGLLPGHRRVGLPHQAVRCLVQERTGQRGAMLPLLLAGVVVLG